MKNFFGKVLSTIVGNLFTLALFVLAFLFLAFIGSMFDFFKGDGVEEKSVLELTFDFPIIESPMEHEPNPFDLNPKPPIYLKDILRAIKDASEDAEIEGISLKMNGFNGSMVQAKAVREALLDFKKKGKFIYSYSNNTTKSYYLQTTADSIFQNPLDLSFLTGLSADVTYYKNMGDKYGIDFQVIRHGEYKSYVEPYIRDNMSEENRMQLTEILESVWGDVSKTIIDSRNISDEVFQNAIDSMYSVTPQEALKAGLYDKLVQEDDYDMALIRRLKLEIEEDEYAFEVIKEHTVSLDKYLSKIGVEPIESEEVAVLYAMGEIIPGDGTQGIQSGFYIDAIHDLMEDDDVKAVVLRVDSPGGSAYASEEIYAALLKLKKKKPLVVSMGGVAASGGYFLSAAGDYIFADKNTITGSIGVLGMIPNFGKLMANHGITKDWVNTNLNAEFPSITSEMSNSAKVQMEKSVEYTYNRFVNIVAQSRKKSFEEIDSVGRGRVWTGDKAIAAGLVDQLGSLEDAVKYAAKKAKLENYSIGRYPFKETNFMDMFTEGQNLSLNSAVKEELGAEAYEVYEQMLYMKQRKGIQVFMPIKFNF